MTIEVSTQAMVANGKTKALVAQYSAQKLCGSVHVHNNNHNG